MERQKVERPQLDNKKINHKDQFELCYLRHRYFNKTDYNPTNKEMEPYDWILSHSSNSTYYTYKVLFDMVGFYPDDILNIARVHLVSYLCLFSISKNEDKYNNFCWAFYKKHGKKPENIDVLNKNKANFTLFLNQRMEELVRICRQKAKNIKGNLAEEYQVFCSPNKPPKILHNLLDNFEQYGFKKVNVNVFKTIRKKAGMKHDSSVYYINNIWYVCVPSKTSIVKVQDLIGADLDPYDNIHHMNPERLSIFKEEEEYWENKQEEFNTISSLEKCKILNKFIKTHNKDSRYKEELSLAIKLLKQVE